MDTFLRSVQPEVNDMFVLSLVLINLLAWMDLFITQVTFCFSINRIGEIEQNVFTQVLFSSTILRYFYLVIAIEFNFILLLHLILKGNFQVDSDF